ncbi:hypothetical protein Tco_0551405 [Tanacetum coccineum]
MRVSYQVDVRSRESSEFHSRHHDAQKDRAAVRAEIEVLRRERLAYEQESIQTRQDLARSEAYYRALEARVTVLETEVRRHEWQRQAADDLAVQHIMRTQALEAGARVDTLEDTASRRYRSFVLAFIWDQGGCAAMAEAKKKQARALRELSDSLDGLRKWSLCLALAIARQLVKSNLRLALYKTMLLHGGMPMLRPLLLKQLMPCHGQHCEEMMMISSAEGNVSRRDRQVEKSIGGLPDIITWQCKGIKAEKYARQKGKESMMICPRTIKTNRIRGRTQARPTLQAIVTGNHTLGLNLCVPNVITIMKVLVHPSAVTARGLSMRPRTNKEEHEEHLKQILELLKKEELYAKFSKCLVGYYRRFIEGFSKRSPNPNAKLTQRRFKFEWGDKQEAAFHMLKQKL